MRLVGTANRWGASILAIGLLAAVLLVACADGRLVQLSRLNGSACAVMTHSGEPASAAVAGAGRAVPPGAVASAVAFVASAPSMGAIARVVPVSVTPSPPADPLHGRLRL